MIRPIKVNYRTRRKHARTKDWHHKDNLRYHPEFHIRKKALLDYYWFFSRPDELEKKHIKYERIFKNEWRKEND